MYVIPATGDKGLKDNKLSGQYAHATVELARRLGVGHIDLYDSMMADSVSGNKHDDNKTSKRFTHYWVFCQLNPAVVPLTKDQ